jgi:hypothetical protein
MVEVMPIAGPDRRVTPDVPVPDASWSGPGPESRGFLVASNAAVYASHRQPAVAPDVMLSVDVAVPRELDSAGVVVPTGAERAEVERTRAETEHARAEAERARAERLAERLRALGVDPDAER